MTEDTSESAAVGYYQRRIRMGERMGIVLKLYAYLGILSFLFGAGFLVYSKLKINLTYDEMLALGISFTGALISVLSYGMLSYRKALYERDVARFAEHQAVGRFIDAWARFEDAISTAAFGAYPSKRFNFREALSRLRSEGKLSVHDQIEADDLLQMRNSLVHGARRFPVSELEKALDQLVSLITRLS